MTSEAELDARLARWLAGRFRERTGVELELDPRAYGLVLETAREVRERLRKTPLVAVSLPFLTRGEEGPLHLDDVVSRRDLERLGDR